MSLSILLKTNLIITIAQGLIENRENSINDRIEKAGWANVHPMCLLGTLLTKYIKFTNKKSLLINMTSWLLG